jgi:hypothetical protein
MIFVIECCQYESSWLPRDYDRSLAAAFDIQQWLEYRIGIPTRIREVSYEQARNAPTADRRDSTSVGQTATLVPQDSGEERARRGGQALGA